MDKKYANNKRNKILEIVALVIAILSLTLGFLALSNQIKIQSNLTVHGDELSFNVVFSSEDNKEENDRIIPTLSSREMSAEKAIINNYGSPIITNLIVNFTKPGQTAKYNFYVYNSGEYMAYLNSIYYENIGRTNLSKICVAKDGTTNDSIKSACDNIKVSIKVGDLTTSKSLYYISGRSLRPRTAQPVEVTIEYLDNNINLNESFDVIFGDIRLYYSMFPNGSNNSEV